MDDTSGCCEQMGLSECSNGFVFWRRGELGQQYLEGDFVPKWTVWLIRAAGIYTNDGHFLEWMLQITHRVDPDIPGDHRLIPIARSSGSAAATPVLALGRTIILLPGEAFSARVNGLNSNSWMGLNYVGFSFPEDMLPRLLGISS